MFMNLFKFYTNRQWLSQFPQFMEPTGMNVLNYRVCFNICKRYTFDIPVRMTTYSLSCHSDVFQSPSRRHIFQNFPRVPGQRLIQTEIYTFQDEIFLFLQTWRGDILLGVMVLHTHIYIIFSIQNNKISSFFILFPASVVATPFVF